MNSNARFPYTLTGVSSLIGRVISVDEWADRARVADRSGRGHLAGARVRQILGIDSKSWDPVLFGSIETIIDVARQALESARVTPASVDAVILVTCTPYELMLDQDAFRMLRALSIPDHVVPLQLGAGCAGLARAAALAANLRASRVLVISYSASSRVTGDGEGGMGSFYRRNSRHPLARHLWASPGIFSDAAAAMVLERRDHERGVVLYSRDSQAGFEDPLIHYLGNGAACPPGTPGADELACFGMAGDQVKRYYTEGMALNHRALRALRPRYVDEVRRIYTHQASPKLVEEFWRSAELPLDKVPTNARELGNLVSPCTLKLLHDDVRAGRVGADDEICILVVGAGPERGAMLVPVEIPGLAAMPVT